MDQTTVIHVMCIFDGCISYINVYHGLCWLPSCRPLWWNDVVVYVQYDNTSSLPTGEWDMSSYLQLFAMTTMHFFLQLVRDSDSIRHSSDSAHPWFRGASLNSNRCRKPERKAFWVRPKWWKTTISSLWCFIIKPFKITQQRSGALITNDPAVCCDSSVNIHRQGNVLVFLSHYN